MNLYVHEGSRLFCVGIDKLLRTTTQHLSNQVGILVSWGIFYFRRQPYEDVAILEK